MGSYIPLCEVHSHVFVQRSREVYLSAKSVEVGVFCEEVERDCIKNFSVVPQYVKTLVLPVLRDYRFAFRRLSQNGQLDANGVSDGLAFVINSNLDLSIIEMLRAKILPFQRVDSG